MEKAKVVMYEALLGVLGIRDNWQNNFRDKG